MSQITLVGRASALFLCFLFFCLVGCGEADRAKRESAVDEASEAEKKSAQMQSAKPTSAPTPPPTTGIANPEIWPSMKSPLAYDETIENRIVELLGKMTLEQKIAQMIQPDIRSFTVDEMRQYGIGSYLNGGGGYPKNDKYASQQDWLELADALYHASMDSSIDGIAIPTMWATDAVHGQNNIVGATIFPHNIGLGATNNPTLIKQIAEATAKEALATGVKWVFAPSIPVVRSDAWGRTYEGYSEDPEIVRSYAAAMVTGLQGTIGDNFFDDSKVIATAKHFLADGGTIGGDDQGDNVDTEETLRDLHAQGYFTALKAGVQVVMASFSSWHGIKMHGNKSFLTGVLKERLGFDGVVVGDWDGHGQVKGCSNASCPQAINAGVDIIMVPVEWRAFLENTLAQVKSGEIPQARIDDAVSRILRVKLRAGLFEGEAPSANRFAKPGVLGKAEHRALARQAVRESLVLLKNKNSVLPLDPKLRVLVTGDAADNIGKQSGGWTLTWQGTGNKNSDFPNGTSIYQGIEEAVSAAGGKVTLSPDGSYSDKPDVVVMVYGENPYAEGEGDLSNLQYQREDKLDIRLLRRFKEQGIPVVSVFITGRPLWVNPELNASDAFVVAWLPGSEGAGVADVIFKDKNGKIKHDFRGKLTFSWPRIDTQLVVNRHDTKYDPLFAYGYGLSYVDQFTLPDDLNEEAEEVYIKSADVAFDIFSGSLGAGLSLYMGDSDHPAVHVNSAVANTQNLGIKEVDWKSQGDALSAVWSGKGEARSYFAFAISRDLEAYVAAQSALVMQLRVDSPIENAISFGVACGTSCGAKVDATKQLKSRPQGQWQTFSVDLACFAKAGAKFGNVSSPFMLHSKGPASISFAEVRLAPGLGSAADIACSTPISQPLDLFTSRPLDGSELYVGNALNWRVPVDRSVISTRGADHLVMRAINWKIQEDSRLATWSGEALAVALLGYPFPKDRMGYLVARSALSFDIRVDEAPSSKFGVRVDCLYPCAHEVDISPQLQKMKIGEWNRFSIDLACFEKGGVDFTKITEPFLMVSEGKASVAFANVQYIPGLGPKAEISCGG